MILVGEVTVGFSNGLFTPPGFIILATLYLLYFILLDSIALRFKLDNVGILLVNFSLYSVLITGLMHGEIADYVLHPENQLITTLIRVQCSFYPLFAFYLLRSIAPRTPKVISPAVALALLLAFFVVLSGSGSIGFIKLIETFRIAPVLSIFFTSLAVIALFIALNKRHTIVRYDNKIFGIWSVVLLLIGLVPGLPFFLLLLGVMIIVSIRYLFSPDFRKSSVA